MLFPPSRSVRLLPFPFPPDGSSPTVGFLILILSPDGSSPPVGFPFLLPLAVPDATKTSPPQNCTSVVLATFWESPTLDAPANPFLVMNLLEILLQGAVRMRSIFEHTRKCTASGSIGSYALGACSACWRPCNRNLKKALLHDACLPHSPLGSRQPSSSPPQDNRKAAVPRNTAQARRYTSRP